MPEGSFVMGEANTLKFNLYKVEVVLVDSRTDLAFEVFPTLRVWLCSP